MRVLATLYEKNVEDFEIRPIELMKGEHMKPAFLKLQPFGLVPVLQDGDLTLFESRAIIRVIECKFEGQGALLYGATLEERALVYQWLEVEVQNFNGPVSSAVFQGLFAQHLESSGNIFLAGDFFSLADLSHLPYLHHLFDSMKQDRLLKSRPAVRAWWDAISSRPAWKMCLEKAAHARKISFESST